MSLPLQAEAKEREQQRIDAEVRARREREAREAKEREEQRRREREKEAAKVRPAREREPRCEQRQLAPACRRKEADSCPSSTLGSLVRLVLPGHVTLAPLARAAHLQAPPPTAPKAPSTSSYSRPASQNPALFGRKPGARPAKEELTRAELRKIKENKSIFGDSAPTSSVLKRASSSSSSAKSAALALSRSRGANQGKAEINKRFAEEGLRALNKDKRDMRTIDEIDRDLQEKRRARERDRLERSREVDIGTLLKKPPRETLSFAKKAVADTPERPTTAPRGDSPLVKDARSPAPPKASAGPSSSARQPSASTSKLALASSSKPAAANSSSRPSASSSAAPSRSRPAPAKSSSPRRPVPSTARSAARSDSGSPPPPLSKRPKSTFNSGAPAKAGKKVASASRKARDRNRDRDISSSDLDSDDSSGSDRRRGRKRKAGGGAGGGGGGSKLRSMIWDAMGLDPTKCAGSFFPFSLHRRSLGR